MVSTCFDFDAGTVLRDEALQWALQSAGRPSGTEKELTELDVAVPVCNPHLQRRPARESLLAVATI